jgi:hypothetical protein
VIDSPKLPLPNAVANVICAVVVLIVYSDSGTVAPSPVTPYSWPVGANAMPATLSLSAPMIWQNPDATATVASSRAPAGASRTTPYSVPNDGSTASPLHNTTATPLLVTICVLLIVVAVSGSVARKKPSLEVTV